MGRHGPRPSEPVVLAGRYRLIDQLGRGGMAEVWRAEDLTLLRPVAIKLLAPPPAGSGPAPARLAWREARDAARLIHANVVQIYDVGSDGDLLYLVMELVAGRDLEQVLREQGPFTPERVMRVGVQTARALAAAHAAGIVHKDVKPGNLLEAADGTVKLTDFGIAGPLTGPAGPAGAPRPTLLGTSAYIAPEQALGGPAGPASDLYSLGCVLYELLTGEPPFTSAEAVNVLHQHVTDPPVPPSALRPDIPAELEQAVLRLLAKNPAERPADASLVASVLDSISSTGTAPGAPGNSTQVLPTLDPAQARRASPEQAQGPPPGPAGPRPIAAWLGQRPLLAAALAAVVLIAVVTAIAAVRESGGRPSAAPSTSKPASSPTRDRRTLSATPGGQPPGSPAEALEALRQRLGRQVAGGTLDPKTADKIGKQLEQIAHRITEDEPEEHRGRGGRGGRGDIAGRIEEIRGRLTEAADEGRWTSDPTTFRLLDQLDGML